MIVLIVLIALALAALVVVNQINRKQMEEQARRMQQRKLKLQADAIVDVVNCLEQTIPNRMMAKYINDESIVLLEEVLKLETGSTTHIENSISHATMRSEELANAKTYPSTSYQKDSDAQITHTQEQLSEAMILLRHICAQGKFSDAELEVFTSELRWGFLMVSVASFIAQGLNFSKLQDRFSAKNYYQKAQNLLMESMLPDPRRMRMIKELGEIIDGSRASMSYDLMSEHALAD